MPRQFILPNDDTIEYIIGIDFGHGETSAAICRVNYQNNTFKDPEDIDLTGSGNKAIPSTMFIKEEADGQQTIYIGYQAVAEQCNLSEGNFYAYFKRSPETLDYEKYPELVVMRTFMQKVYETICLQRAGELMEGNTIKNNHVVFIACPSQSLQWGDNAMQNYVQLALDAGLPIAGATIDNKFTLSGIVRESRAAYIRAMQKDEAAKKATKGILVIDYGSSTIDLTYYKEGEKPLDKGYSIGASEVESLIYAYLEEEHPELGGEQNPEAARMLKENAPHISKALLYEIRKAKENFYTNFNYANKLELRYKFRPRIDTRTIDVEFSKSLLVNTILKQYIEKVKEAFVDFKENVIHNDIVTLLVITGGASRMDFVRIIARNAFGDEAIELKPQDASLTVSNGIATAGRADVLLYYLAKELLSRDISSIYTYVRPRAIERIGNLVLNTMQEAYESFSNGYKNKQNTISELTKDVKKRLTKIQPSFKKELDNAFCESIQAYINEHIVPEINNYLQIHFPQYKVSIGNYIVPNDMSISLSHEDLETITVAINDSIIQISEGLIVALLHLVYNIIADTSTAIYDTIRNAATYLINKTRPYGEEIPYRSISEDIKNNRVEWTDADTVVGETQRQEVFKNFIEKKPSYLDQLKKNIEEKVPSFDSACDADQKKVIEDYIIYEINRIQMQIK